MNMIVAVDENWAIGNKGDLLVRIPNDQKMFRNETIGKVIVLGRKTMDTFPQKQPLAKRVNIILSKNKDYKVKDAFVVHSMEELMTELKNILQKIFILSAVTAFISSCFPIAMWHT